MCVRFSYALTRFDWDGGVLIYLVCVCVFFFEYLVSKWRFDVARSKSIWSAISVITFDLIQAISAKLPLRISQPAESL